MVSGIVSRVKGKTAYDWGQIGKGGERQYVTTIQVGVQSTTIPAGGLTVLTSTAGAAVIAIDAPQPGLEKTIWVSTMSSGHIIVKTNSTGVVFFDAANSFWAPSTTVGTGQGISLMGVSTSQWAFLGTSPISTTSGGGTSGLQATS